MTTGRTAARRVGLALALAIVAMAIGASGCRSAARGSDDDEGPLRVGGAGPDDVAVLALPKPENHDPTLCFPQELVHVPRAADGRIRIELIARESGFAPWLSEQRVAFLADGKCGYLDADGAIVIPARYECLPVGLRPFQDGRAVVADGVSCGYIDGRGEVVIPMRFAWAYDFRDGMGCVREGQRWGVLRPDGSWIVTPSLLRADPLVGGVKITRPDGTEGWLHADGSVTDDP